MNLTDNLSVETKLVISSINHISNALKVGNKPIVLILHNLNCDIMFDKNTVIVGQNVFDKYFDYELLNCSFTKLDGVE